MALGFGIGADGGLLCVSDVQAMNGLMTSIRDRSHFSVRREVALVQRGSGVARLLGVRDRPPLVRLPRVRGRRF
jgi:hypothetical protein